MTPSPPSLDYVSPLPPVRSGISDYSRDLVPELAAMCDLRLVRLPGQPVAPDLLRRFTVVASDGLGEEGRLPLYQMGNNLHHEAILELAARVPGVLTLHDLVLHHLLLSRTVGRDEFLPYAHELVRDHGWIGWEVSRPIAWGAFSDAPQFSLFVNRSLLRSQRGVLTHSAWAAEQIRAEDPEVRVRVVPMGIPLPARATADEGRRFRRRLGIPEGAPVLGSLGFQTPMKRTAEVVRALARSELADAHLIVAGEVASILDLDAIARESGVAARVHVTGFLPYEDFHAAVAACDLCVNLRYPTAGETSASLLRILAVGRAVLVSDYAQFAELPETLAAKVPTGEQEIEALAALAGRLLADPDRRRSMAAAARDFVREHHAPAEAARRILDACGELALEEPLPPVAAASRRPTSLTWSFLGGRLDVAGIDLPWRVGEARAIRARLTNESFARWLPTAAGPGGMHLRVVFLDAARQRLPRQRWLRLHQHLEPGESMLLETSLRRPPRAHTLRVEQRLNRAPGEPSVYANLEFRQRRRPPVLPEKSVPDSHTVWALLGPVWQMELGAACGSG